jgi:adenylate kinase family enzyme
VRKIAVIASASGNGKTTFGRELADRLGVQFVELDALVHGPGWVETPNDELRAQLEPVLATEGWVIDGSYQHKLGNLVLESADVIVWLDLPIRVWLPRLLRRTWRRIRGREQIWSGNPSRLQRHSGDASRSSPGRSGPTSAGGASGRTRSRISR